MPPGALIGGLAAAGLTAAAGALLVLADVGVRLAPTDAEPRLGVAAALIGAPVFIWIAARRRAVGG